RPQLAPQRLQHLTVIPPALEAVAALQRNTLTLAVRSAVAVGVQGGQGQRRGNGRLPVAAAGAACGLRRGGLAAGHGRDDALLVQTELAVVAPEHEAVRIVAAAAGAVGANLLKGC